ncbi:DUF4242 domain-containing protein [Ilyobacter polytropus]|uniref:DUF4242 domain-containing protein n=1 Tax=Ilyobacter polytropus (strain ATCC 51220 / DSM 2926 / LMG 16218 / CuHBu1) TaxID=572544 RepID=E3HDW6_ILYPC|nr:DUF4242 domain-containing protein [Ilyobacter polytropus]ADO84578.1 conserved hypothetical protein [Ilyobacter polytropus DSM 2926]
MPKYIIERNIQGAGNFSLEKLKEAAKSSCDVLRKMGPEIQWVESYVTENKIYCVYISPNEEMIREHAEKDGIPVDKISKINTIIDPTTAE